MTTIDTRRTLDRAGDDLLAAATQIEGVSATLIAMASDIDGMKLMTDVQVIRAIELLAGCCDAVTHRLGIVHDMIEDLTAEAAGGREGTQNE